MLNAKFRGRNLVRTINLIPACSIVAGLAFRWMLDDQYGLVRDWLLRLTGLSMSPGQSLDGRLCDPSECLEEHALHGGCTPGRPAERSR